MVDRKDLDRLAASQQAAARMAQDAAKRLWRRAMEAPSPQTQRDLLVELVPALVDSYGDIAATAAREWYEQVRAHDTGDTRYQGMLGEGFPSQAVQDSIRWRAGVLWHDPEMMGRFLHNATDRWVKYYGRGTVMACVAHDPLHPCYAVVPQGKCCAYCTMIASRGFDYRTEDTACATMHDNCGCMPCPSWDAKRQVIAGYDPDAMAARYRQAARAVEGLGDPPAWAAGLDGFNKRDRILEAMRRLDPDEYTDGVHGYTHDKATKSKAGVGDLNLASWRDYRASLAERFIAANNPEWKMPPAKPATVPANLPEALEGRLTAKTWNHILYGNRAKERNVETGKKEWQYHGAHMHGYGWIAGGDEWPKDFTQNDILKAIDAVIGNDAVPPSQGTYDGVVDGRRIRVVVSKGIIRTAFIRGRSADE